MAKDVEQEKELQEACLLLKKILTSGDNVIKTAIKANLHAFAQSVDIEKKLKTLKKTNDKS